MSSTPTQPLSSTSTTAVSETEVRHLGAKSSSSSSEIRPQPGVERAKAVRATISKLALYILHIGIYILAAVVAVEGQVTLTLGPYVTSDLKSHSKLSTVLTVVNIVASVSKPPIAKLSDVFGRVQMVILLISAFTLGEIVVATSRDIRVYIFSQVLYALGSTGTYVINQIIIADTTNLQDRVLMSLLPMTPYFFSGWLGPYIANKSLKSIGWRWCTGIFAFVLPLAASLLIVTLLVVNAKSKRRYKPDEPEKNSIFPQNFEEKLLPVQELERNTSLSLSSHQHQPSNLKAKPSSSSSGGAVKRKVFREVRYAFEQLDIIGSLLVVLSLSMLLVPLTLTQGKSSDWASPAIFVPIIFGGLLSIGLIYWEYSVASYPVIPLKLFRSNKIILTGCLSATLYFTAYCILQVYFTSYLQVDKKLKPSHASYVNNIYDWVATTFGILAGVFIKKFKRVKPLLIVGSIIIPLGYLCMSLCFIFNGPLAVICVAMGLIALGGGLFLWPAQLSVQSEATSQQLSTVIALFLTCTMIGYSIGSAIAGAIWTNMLRKNLSKFFPSTRVEDIANDINIALQMEGIERINVSYAYRRTEMVLCIAALVLAALGTVSSLWVKCTKISKEIDGNPNEDQHRLHNSSTLVEMEQAGHDEHNELDPGEKTITTIV